MKSNRREKRILISAVGLFFVLMFFPCMGNAAIPQKINYQGYLTSASGVPINGTLQMTFKIYDITTGGVALWTEVHSVEVDKGVYNVVLGEGTPTIPINLTFDTQYYLEITVGTDPEMTPRIPLTSVGYAFRAKTVETMGAHNHSGEDIASGTVDEARIDGDIARDSEVTAAVNTHASNTNNPHSTTAAQVGAVALNQNNSITSAMIVNGAVTDEKITGLISSSKISSTGLNADTLDSLEASAFSLDGHNHDAAYVNQAGDTMSGTLAVSVGGSSSAVSGATTGTGNAGNFQINNASNSVSALYSTTNGSGPAVYGAAAGTGRAGLFSISNPSNTASALHGTTNATGPGVSGYTIGTGNAGNFQINNPSNSLSALYSTTNGSGPGISGNTTGSGPGIRGNTTGTGHAGNFQIDNASNSIAALIATTNGSGSGINGNTTGTGHAGNFQINNASNTVAALYATTNGSGAAGYFNGNVVVTGNLTYNTPKTRYWSVKGSEFIPWDDANLYMKSANGGLSGGGYYGAPIHLSDGAVITRIRVYYKDNAATDFSVRLDRSDMMGGVNLMAEVFTTGAVDSFRTVESTTISDNVIDNSQYGYAAVVPSNMNGFATHMLAGVVIEYTVTDPLP